MFFKISVLKNFGIFTGKQLCWSLFLVKLQALALFRMGLFGAAHRYGDKMVPLLLLHISYNDETWQLYLPLPCFCCSSCWPYTHICLQSYLVNLEQVTNHYDCLEEVSVPFLPTDTNWKGRKLDKSLTILGSGQITVSHTIAIVWFTRFHCVFQEGNFW